MNSYQAELKGILAAIAFANKLCKESNIHKGMYTFYCDSKGALYAAFGLKWPTPRWSSYDLMWQIR
jgi:hypothetical protein